MLAGVQAKPERVAELKKLRQSLDPFQLGTLIDEKLQRIYDLVACRRVTITRPLASKLSWPVAAKSCSPSNSILT